MIRFASDEVFVVTGASAGIGRCIAALLNELGATVIAVGRDRTRLDAVKASVPSPALVHSEVRDLSRDLESIPEWVGGLSGRFGLLRGMVHSAGLVEVVPLKVLSLDGARRLFDLNYFAGIALAKGFSRKGVFAGPGSSILFLSSIQAIRGTSGVSTYSASKGALNAGVRSLAVELQPKGIRVNAVAPGYIDTEMTRAHPPESGRELGDPKEVAPLCAFLLSGVSRFITGQIVVVDGGGQPVGSDLAGFGISLVRLSLDDIEMVRQWRNDDEIRQYVVFRGTISPEQQRKWFDSVENPLNHYSLIVYEGEKVGLTHVKNVDPRTRSAEGGMFIYRKDLRNSVFGYRAAIVGSDSVFLTLKLDVITGCVLKENRRAIRFNLGLGHVFDPEVPGSAVVTCRLTREAYERVRPGLVEAIR